MDDTNITKHIDNVRAMQRELSHLRNVNQQQANTIGLLREQVGNVTAEYETAVAEHKEETRLLRRRCEQAERAKDEVNAILQVAAKHVMDGLRAIKGDSEPAVAPAVGNVHKIDPNTTAQRALRDSMAHEG